MRARPYRNTQLMMQANATRPSWPQHRVHATSLGRISLRSRPDARLGTRLAIDGLIIVRRATLIHVRGFMLKVGRYEIR